MFSFAPLSKFDEERQQHEQKMAKMESEMKAVFQQKVVEKETKLKQSEDEVIESFCFNSFSYTPVIVK